MNTVKMTKGTGLLRNLKAWYLNVTKNRYLSNKSLWEM